MKLKIHTTQFDLIQFFYSQDRHMPLRGCTIRFMDIYKFIQLDTTQFPYHLVGKKVKMNSVYYL